MALTPRASVAVGGGGRRLRGLAATGDGALAALLLARDAPPALASASSTPAPGLAILASVSLQPAAPAVPAAAPAPSVASLADRLEKLGALFSNGVLTEEEFAKAKALELGL